MQTYQQFADKHGITFTAKQIAHRTDSLMADMPRHFRCTLTRDGRKMRIEFSQGSAHNTPPTVADVLYCIASDISGIESARDFTDWANEYGLDEDKRSTKRMYDAIRDQHEQLVILLDGGALRDELLYETNEDGQE